MPRAYRILKFSMAPVLHFLLHASQLTLGAPNPAAPVQRSDGHQINYASRVQHGAIASESKVCSDVGAHLMRLGGSAADAVVGTALCVGVVSMYHSGLGGGGFMIVRSTKGEYEQIDFRESAPAGASQDMFNADPELSKSGGLASGVPGELAGLWYLHEKYGHLSWETVVSPAVIVAQDGFTVTDDLARYMKSATEDYDFLMNEPEWAVDFAPNGTRLKVGETMTRQRYALLLKRIAEDGPEAFYSGAYADAMLKALESVGGIMTQEDLKNYKVHTRPAQNTNYRGYKVWSCTAPSSGTLALSVLQVLDGYEDFALKKQTRLGPLDTHRLSEAFRFGYGMRTRLGDPLFLPNLTKYEDNILSANTSNAVRERITDDMTHDISYYNPEHFEVLDHPGTAQISAVDADGMAISLTSTINLLFGSKVMVPESGLIMNNEMNDFSVPNSTNAFGFEPSPSNFIKPGKRPLSSITPVIVEDSDGKVYLVTGAAGGSRIPTATLQVLINVLGLGLNLTEAISQPRIHDQLSPNVVTFEDIYDNSTFPAPCSTNGQRDGLNEANFSDNSSDCAAGSELSVPEFMTKLGHNVTWVGTGLSSVHAVRVIRHGNLGRDPEFEAVGETRQQASGGSVV